MPLWKKVKLYNLSVRGLSHKMARKSPPRTVFVSKPLNMGYNDAMSRLRQWLDSKRLEFTGFKITTEGPIGFEISFSSEHDAAEFQLFNWPWHDDHPDAGSHRATRQQRS